MVTQKNRTLSNFYYSVTGGGNDYNFQVLKYGKKKKLRASPQFSAY